MFPNRNRFLPHITDHFSHRWFFISTNSIYCINCSTHGAVLLFWQAKTNQNLVLVTFPHHWVWRPWKKLNQKIIFNFLRFWLHLIWHLFKNRLLREDFHVKQKVHLFGCLSNFKSLISNSCKLIWGCRAASGPRTLLLKGNRLRQSDLFLYLYFLTKHYYDTSLFTKCNVISLMWYIVNKNFPFFFFCLFYTVLNTFDENITE